MLKLEARVLHEREIFGVLDDVSRRAKRSLQSRQNLIIFRLSCCCGLRASEISSLLLRDVNVDSCPPSIEVCRTYVRDGKVTRRGRLVSLEIDDRTRKDIVAWRLLRYKQTGRDRFAPLICGFHSANLGKPLSIRTLAKRWKSAIRCLGRERVRQLSISSGRHSCILQLLRRGGSLAAVQRFAGHASVKQTEAYLRLLPDSRLHPNRSVFQL